MVILRLLSVSLENAGGNLTPIRTFDYHASGQVSGDLRGANEYLYGLNDRGRLTTITRNGEDVASYIHDESEQRIAKTVDGVTTHYHYDLDGRLISETNGTTGETLRDYVWLGLMPIAVIDGTVITPPQGECDPELISLLEAELAAATATAAALEAQILDWDGNIAFRQAKILEMRSALDGLSGKRREKLADKITKWESLISQTQSKIDDGASELAAILTQMGETAAALEAQQAICDGVPTAQGAGIFYLHADHLGRPQFATDSSGSVVWDMGEGVTPFGYSVNLAGAFAQRLMFPGQYADIETGDDTTTLSPATAVAFFAYI